jgi:thioredoxin 1
MYKLLIFSADWCKPCKALEPIIDSLEPLYDAEVEFKHVDIEKDLDLVEDYHIKNVPTLVYIDNDGEIHKILSGLHSKDIIEDWLKDLIFKNVFSNKTEEEV